MSNFNRVLMDGISDMVFVMRVKDESEFIYDFVNQAAMEGMGITQDVLGKVIWEVRPQDHAGLLYEQYKKVVTNQKSVTFEDSYISRLGEKYYSETKLTPILNDMKQCEQVVGVVKDISKEKVAE